MVIYGRLMCVQNFVMLFNVGKILKYNCHNIFTWFITMYKYVTSEENYKNNITDSRRRLVNNLFSNLLKLGDVFDALIFLNSQSQLISDFLDAPIKLDILFIYFRY